LWRFNCNIVARVTYVCNFIYNELCHYTFCNSYDNIRTIKICWVTNVHYNSKVQLKPNCNLLAKHLFSHNAWKEGKTCFESIFPKENFHINSLLIYFQVWCNSFFGFFVNIDFILNFCAFRRMGQIYND